MRTLGEAKDVINVVVVRFSNLLLDDCRVQNNFVPYDCTSTGEVSVACHCEDITSGTCVVSVRLNGANQQYCITQSVDVRMANGN